MLIDNLQGPRLTAELGPDRLEVETFRVLADPSASLDTYARAALWAKRLRHLRGLDKHRPAVLIGIACYRLELFELAENILRLTRWGFARNYDGRIHPNGTAVLSMIVWRLGRKDEARQLLGELNDPKKVKPFKSSPYLREASKLVGVDIDPAVLRQ